MSNLGDEVNKVETAASQEVVVVKTKVSTFIKKYVPHAVVSVLGYVAGHFGVLSTILKHIF